MMKTLPNVVVIIPCFNAERTLEQTLDSVVAQTFTDVKIVAVNDGSTDQTAEILDAFAGKHPGLLEVLTQKNQGQTVAKNTGIRHSQSKYVAFLDSDDLWDPRKLEQQVQLLDANPHVGMCYTAAQKIDESNHVFDTINVSPDHRGNCRQAFIIRNNVVASSVLARRSAIEQVGFYDISFAACENWDLWIRIAGISAIEYIDEPLTKYRIHSQNMSKGFEKILQSRLQVIDKHLPEQTNSPAIRSLRKEALFKAHLAFAKMNVQILNFGKARSELIKAIRVAPKKIESYSLFLKTLLGKNTFKLLRSLKPHNWSRS